MYKLLFLFLLTSSVSFSQTDYDKVIYFYGNFEFEESSTQYLYGNNVVLRKKASSESTALDTLAIGSEITILKKSKKESDYNGLSWSWYKVKQGKKKGYILGGLISLASDEINGDRYLTTVSTVKKEDEEYTPRILNYRILTSTGKFRTGKTPLSTSAFTIQASDNKGVEGVESILYIDFVAEACGVDGGGVYVFYDGNKLKEAIQVSSVSDGGVFWFHEELTFPADENGQDGYIIYEREYGEEVNEEYMWTRSVKNTLYLKWEDGEITPNPSDLKFDEN